MKNKKVLVLTGVVITALVVLAVYAFTQKTIQPQNNSSQSQSELRKALGKDELIVGIDEAFPPVSFKDIDGNYVGIDIDFAKELEKRTGVKVTFKPVEWDSIIPALLKKDIDVVWSGMGVTPEREQKVNFVVYSKDPKGVAFVLKNSSIAGANDLKGKVIAVQSGSYQEQDLKDGKIIPVNSWKELKSMSTLPEAILDLKIGRVDAVIASQESAAYYIEKTLNESSKYSSIDIGYGIGKGGIAFRKEDEAVRIAVETVVNQIISDGTASQISMKWLGIDKYKNWTKE
jgi:polar amino acid transport system substrate-binding protein